MNARRILVASCAALAVVGVLASCSSKGSTGTTSSSSGAAGPVTLTMVEYQQIRADAVKKLLPDFEAAMAAKGQQVKVNLISDILTDEQFKTKITQQYNAGNSPDVPDYGGTLVPGFAGAGYLLDLTPYLGKWLEWGSFYQGVKDQVVQPDGKT